MRTTNPTLRGALGAAVLVVAVGCAPAPTTTVATTTTPTTAVPAPGIAVPQFLPVPTPPPGMDGRAQDGRIVGLSDALAGVPVTGADPEAAAAARDRLAGDLADALARVAKLSDNGSRLAAEITAIDDVIQRERIHHDKLTGARRALTTDMHRLAVERYVSGRDDDLLPPDGLALDEKMERSQVATLGAEASRATASSLDRVAAGIDVSQRRSTQLATRRAQDETDAAEVASQRASAENDVVQFAAALPAAEQLARDARLAGFAAGSDLPMVALDAYWRAALRERIIDPTCRIQWWALAGIGRTESGHGQSGGATPGSGGVLSQPIIGLALNGSGATAAIADSDKGSLDGDPIWDHAVGPMQFIPGTWRRFAVDINGDGVADPQNLYDAAAAAATYLCRYGPGLDLDEPLQRAFFSYNHSASYVATVLERSHAYQSLPIPATSPPVVVPPG